MLLFCHIYYISSNEIYKKKYKLTICLVSRKATYQSADVRIADITITSTYTNLNMEQIQKFQILNLLARFAITFILHYINVHTKFPYNDR